ncbi:hypothetical protein EEX84_04860 [Planococcus salinus]|uniref:Uncharacterized protein n=1 Tax=Planococcus salinus TaxID=1848460 RepID=A0A3M8P8H3_9BACL|nr:hypothetical protein EEX84_04860 [Planococcus salinus]
MSLPQESPPFALSFGINWKFTSGNLVEVNERADLFLTTFIKDMEQNSGDSSGIAKCRNPLGRPARVSSAQARRKAELFCGISTF